MSNTSLQLDNLHYDVTEAVIYNIFQKFGNVLNVRILRNRLTNQSLGSGIVTYQTNTEARYAMECLNREKILDQPCKISWLRERSETNADSVDTNFKFMSVMFSGAICSKIEEALVCLNTQKIEIFNMQADNTKLNHAPTVLHLDDNVNIRSKITKSANKASVNDSCASLSKNIDPVKIKEILKNKLKTLLPNHGGIVCAKILKVLLTLENDELQHVIVDESSLKMKVDEVLVTLSVDKTDESHSFQPPDSISSTEDRYESSFDNDVEEEIIEFHEANMKSSQSGRDPDNKDLSEKIHAIIDPLAGNRADKYTKMFLKLDHDDLLYLLQFDNLVKMKLDQFMEIEGDTKGFDVLFSLVFEGKKKIIMLDENIKKQVEEINRMKILIGDLQNCVSRHQIEVAQLSENKQNALYNINLLIKAIKDVSDVYGKDSDTNNAPHVWNNLEQKYDEQRERLRNRKTQVNLYINNLGKNVDEDWLLKEFSIFGNITSAKVMLNEKNNTSLGYGFVCFSSTDEAARAITAMNGKIINGKTLYVALCQTKKERQAHSLSQSKHETHPPQSGNSNSEMMNIPANVPFPLIQEMLLKKGLLYNVPMGAPGLPLRQFVIVDPQLNLKRNALPITGNVQLNQVGPQQNLAFNGTPPRFQHPLGMTQSIMNHDRMKKPDIETPINFSNADSMEAKQLLGETIYPLVYKYNEDLAGKITGMFLELDNTELLYMIENENSLRMKIEEALIVLNAGKGEGGSLRHD